MNIIQLLKKAKSAAQVWRYILSRSALDLQNDLLATKDQQIKDIKPSVATSVEDMVNRVEII